MGALPPPRLMVARPLAVALLALALARCDPAAPTASLEGCDGQRYPSLAATPYVLPFPVGTRYRMNLGNCSGAHPYHGPDSPDRYAYDFGMSIGTLITASRAGHVVHVVESGRDGSHPNNLVVVDHGDGTFAQYMHLTRDGGRRGGRRRGRARRPHRAERGTRASRATPTSTSS